MSTAILDRPAPPALGPEPPAPALASPYRAAAEDLAAMTPGIGAFGLALGIAAHALAIGTGATIAGAGVVYAGTAQLTAMTLIHGGAGLAAVVVSAAVVNARLMLYGAVLEPHFRRQPLWFRLLFAHFLIDQTFLSASVRTDLDEPDRFRRYWIALGGGLLVAFSATVAAGVLLAPVLPPLPHLGLVGLGLFVAMLVPRLTSRPAIASAAAGALVAPLVALVLPSLALLAGAAAGIAAGVAAERRAS